MLLVYVGWPRSTFEVDAPSPRPGPERSEVADARAEVVNNRTHLPRCTSHSRIVLSVDDVTR